MENHHSASTPPAGQNSSRAVAWISLAVVALAAIGLVAFLKSCETSGKAVDVAKTIVKAAPEIAARFKTGTITHTFIEQNTEVSPTKGDILELASIRQTETFSQRDSKSILSGMVNLGDTNAEIRAPVTFRYHLRLSDPWRLATRDNVCLVLAPPMRASQPPAIHTGELVKRTEQGWARFNADEKLEALERSMTPELEKRAENPNHRKLAREAARQAVAEFVKNWLLREDRWREDRLSSVVVIFADETQGGVIKSDDDLEQMRLDPTVSLQRKKLDRLNHKSPAHPLEPGSDESASFWTPTIPSPALFRFHLSPTKTTTKHHHITQKQPNIMIDTANTTNPPKQTTLYFRQGSSDKTYQVSLSANGSPDHFLVNFAFGKRGATLQTGTKTPVAVDYVTALKTFNQLVATKLAKGYQPVYLGEREDIEAAECTQSQLKYRCEPLPSSTAAISNLMVA